MGVRQNLTASLSGLAEIPERIHATTRFEQLYESMHFSLEWPA